MFKARVRTIQYTILAGYKTMIWWEEAPESWLKRAYGLVPHAQQGLLVLLSRFVLSQPATS